jgi:hypothetical protein
MNKRKGDEEIPYVKMTRDNFMRLSIMGTLVSICFALWTLGVFPWTPITTHDEGMAKHKKDMKHVWDLKKRMLVLETEFKDMKK